MTSIDFYGLQASNSLDSFIVQLNAVQKTDLSSRDRVALVILDRVNTASVDTFNVRQSYKMTLYDASTATNAFRQVTDTKVYMNAQNSYSFAMTQNSKRIPFKRSSSEAIVMTDYTYQFGSVEVYLGLDQCDGVTGMESSSDYSLTNESSPQDNLVVNLATPTATAFSGANDAETTPPTDIGISSTQAMRTESGFS
jgi:hypothetical protein